MNRRRVISVLAAVVAALAGAPAGLAITGWDQPTYALGLGQHFAGRSQSQSGSVVLTLVDHWAATISVSVVGAGDEVLTHSATGDTLATHYKLTGAALGASADNDWVPAATFVQPGRTYTVEGSGTSEITMWAQGTSAADRANDAGAYSASVTLTVSW